MQLKKKKKKVTVPTRKILRTYIGHFVLEMLPAEYDDVAIRTERGSHKFMFRRAERDRATRVDDNNIMQ